MTNTDRKATIVLFIVFLVIGFLIASSVLWTPPYKKEGYVYSRAAGICVTGYKP
jgi:hypothetical protein